MSTPGEELSSLDFESLIGGPLIAVVNAQAQAALSTVNFIKSVGFEPPTDEEMDFDEQKTETPIYVTFKYPKETAPFQPAIGDANNTTALPPYDDSDPTNIIGDPAWPNGRPAYQAAVPAQWEVQILEVPILTMLPIPFIRIESTTIDFHAKITSVTYKKTDSRFRIGTQLTTKFGGPGLLSFLGSAKLKVSTSYQRTSSQGTNVERTYSMRVHVRAVQDEIPAGMERILGILEEAIKARPITRPEPTVVDTPPA